MKIQAGSRPISRRSLLTSGFAGGLLLAFHVPLRAAQQGAHRQSGGGDVKFAPNAFIRIAPAGRITLVMPQVEMGQGVYTSIPMILAEELDADFSQVALEHAPPDDALYANPILHYQVTGNSNSIRAWWKPLRTAGANARAMLVRAAAEQWSVDSAECTAANSQVIHHGSGRQQSYGALADAASLQTLPNNVALKNPSDFVLIGKPLKRLDTPEKVLGKTIYGIDVMLPDMKFATLKACPVVGGKVVAVDDRAARKIPGVRQVVVLDDLVAVVGNHMWAAKKGLEALVVDWDVGPNGGVNQDDIWRDIRSASEKTGVVATSRGDIEKGLLVGERVEASYELPFLAHAAMEPMNATVHCKPDSCEIWTGTQVLARVQADAAKAVGLPVKKVIARNHILGGGFGRRLETDMVTSAVRIARHVDGPVKVVWTREEDVQHDFYRPAYHDAIAATVSDGKIASWKYKVTGPAIFARRLPAAFKSGIDVDAIDSAVNVPYDIPNFHVEYVRAEPRGVPTGFWRGVGANNNVFAVESFMDELARKADKDPIEFRRSMLGGRPRFLAALNLAAEKSGWGEPLPARVGRGVSLQPSFASFIATIVEAEVDTQGEVRVRRVTSAVDTGIAVNPDTVMAQVEGGLIFGLTAALYGEITIAGGRVKQSNFNDYRMLRINEAPRIDVHIIKSGEAPGGIGETGVTGSAPALRNAIYAATGVALRRLPIDRRLIAAKRS
ncbi:xanthine dehydrogenase family protein molybdopterin-binding subunit [Tardiphaga robiniae]|uniref:Xanthine dehydrogenase family protein molybdopterin-binding subunit n=1 Tax=Tardiphaga robiniae TaxID=943830 RepID=A0A7G6TTZ3_9BRAD|nr:xanthine dehydrogenase family protein molybdopterin-binding subunit [Tardiphaga robiniae]QND70225.1 xanthine dehydrogenase family protein molybdopterin-binding subunit [Tardiphaga robiniae]